MRFFEKRQLKFRREGSWTLYAKEHVEAKVGNSAKSYLRCETKISTIVDILKFCCNVFHRCFKYWGKNNSEFYWNEKDGSVKFPKNYIKHCYKNLNHISLFPSLTKFRRDRTLEYTLISCKFVRQFDSVHSWFCLANYTDRAKVIRLWEQLHSRQY